MILGTKYWKKNGYLFTHFSFNGLAGRAYLSPKEYTRIELQHPIVANFVLSNDTLFTSKKVSKEILSKILYTKNLFQALKFPFYTTQQLTSECKINHLNGWKIEHECYAFSYPEFYFTTKKITDNLTTITSKFSVISWQKLPHYSLPKSLTNNTDTLFMENGQYLSIQKKMISKPAFILKVK